VDEHDLVYLFLDAVYLKLRPDDAPADGDAGGLALHCSSGSSG